MVGEAWSVIAGRGAKFQNQRDPQVVFRIGNPGDVGIVEISDVIFSTVGPGELNLGKRDHVLTTNLAIQLLVL
jgi:hypothetical protein